MQGMNWDDLRIFLRVARSGQIAHASSMLGVDATTVSRRIRRLERDLGQTLFEQQRDGQRLTEAGERLLQRAEEVDRSMGRLDEEDIEGDRQGGVVRVSASEGFGTWFVAHHLRAFAKQHPTIGVDLAATNGFLSPSRRETDVAILLARPRRGPLITRRLADYGLRLFASRRYLEAHDPVESTADLRRHRLIGYIPDLIYAPELDYLDEVGPGLEPHLRSSSINAQYRMAASGNGIAVLPCFIGDADPALARLLPEVWIRRSFWLVTHRDTRRTQRVDRFVDWLVATTNEHRDALLGM